jgi:hypothetical protein
MRIRRVISRPIIDRATGRLTGSINAVVVGSMNEPRKTSTRVSSRQRLHIVQKGSDTEVFEEEIMIDDGDGGEK